MKIYLEIMNGDSLGGKRLFLAMAHQNGRFIADIVDFSPTGSCYRHSFGHLPEVIPIPVFKRRRYEQVRINAR